MQDENRSLEYLWRVDFEVYISNSFMQQRLIKERTELEAGGYIVNVEKDNLWVIFLQGPETSAFEGGQFQVEFKLDNFPFKGPIVTFRTKIFHPNVSDKGEVCEDMIETGPKWAPTKKIVSIMEKLKSLMLAPNLDTPMNNEAAADYKNGSWNQKAKQWTQQYAK